MQNLEIINIDDAIEKLIQYRKEHGNKISVCIVDLDNGKSWTEKKSIEDGCGILQRAETVAFNEDDFFPHMMAFSVKANYKEKLPRTGKMHDFFFHSRIEIQ